MRIKLQNTNTKKTKLTEVKMNRIHTSPQPVRLPASLRDPCLWLWGNNPFFPLWLRKRLLHGRLRGRERKCLQDWLAGYTLGSCQANSTIQQTPNFSNVLQFNRAAAVPSEASISVSRQLEIQTHLFICLLWETSILLLEGSKFLF